MINQIGTLSWQVTVSAKTPMPMPTGSGPQDQPPEAKGATGE